MKTLLSALAATLVLSCAHAPQANLVSGWVSDAACGAEHVGGANPSCVLKCLKGGADIGHPEWTPQAMVLVVDGSEKILTVENPDALKGYEAKHVKLDATVTGETIRVARVLAP